jgi:CDP-glucose 4,6-dehydratase
VIDFGTFKGKRVLVTGHTGFKGSWLVAILERAGAKVKGLSLAPLKGSHFEQLGFQDRHGGDSYCDIRDFAKVTRLIESFDPEIIFHLAAQPLIRESFTRTRETFEVNFMGGVNILESVRKSPSLMALVFITSDKAYENVEWEWGYRESDRLGGLDPYSASKGAVELAVSSYARSILIDNQCKIATARAGNVIGGGDWAKDRLVPDTIRSLRADEPVVIRSPRSTRPWQHVLEPLSGYLLLAQKMLQGETEIQDSYNFGPDSSEQRTVADVVNGLMKHHGHGTMKVSNENEGTHEAVLLQLNCDRAKQGLGWFPRWSFEETLANTGEWYRNHADGLDPRGLTDDQISSYFKELT